MYCGLIIMLDYSLLGLLWRASFHDDNILLDWSLGCFYSRLVSFYKDIIIVLQPWCGG